MLTSSQDLNKLRIIPYQLQGTLIATEMGKKKKIIAVWLQISYQVLFQWTVPESTARKVNSENELFYDLVFIKTLS